MNFVEFKKSCLNCYTYSPFPHIIMWHDVSELYVDGKMIWEEEMIEKILEWHKFTNCKCENCDGKDNWDIWDVTIDKRKLKCEERRIHIILKDGRIRIYEFLDFAFIIKDTIRELDLNLNRIDSIPPEYRFNSRNIAEKIIIREVIKMMKTFFETDFLPSKEIYNEALEYFREFCDIKFNQKELNYLNSVLSNWEIDILEVTKDDCYNFRDYDPSKILPKIYLDIPNNLLTEEVYKYFRLQYFKMQHRLTHVFEAMSIELKLTKDIKTIDHIKRILRSKNKL